MSENRIGIVGTLENPKTDRFLRESHFGTIKKEPHDPCAGDNFEGTIEKIILDLKTIPPEENLHYFLITTEDPDNVIEFARALMEKGIDLDVFRKITVIQIGAERFSHQYDPKTQLETARIPIGMDPYEPLSLPNSSPSKTT